jgi:hypothetical protein
MTLTATSAGENATLARSSTAQPRLVGPLDPGDFGSAPGEDSGSVALPASHMNHGQTAHRSQRSKSSRDVGTTSGKVVALFDEEIPVRRGGVSRSA